MFDTLLQYDALWVIISKTLLISIPEEFFLVMFTLILVGEFEYWKEPECKRLINKFDYVRVFVPTVVSALLSETLRYMGLKSGIYLFVPFFVMFTLLVFTNDIFGDASALKWIGKAFMFMLLGFLILGLTEFIYTPFLLYSANQTVDEISKNIPLYFMASLPARLLQYSLLVYFVSRKRTLLKGKLLKPILSRPLLSIIFSLFVFFNILFLQIMIKAIIYDEVIISVSYISKIFIVLGVVLFPMLNISGLLWGFYLLKDKDTYDKKIATDRLRNLLKKIELYTNSGNYDNIRWKLNEIGMGIEEVADSLYRENGTDKHR